MKYTLLLILLFGFLVKTQVIVNKTDSNRLDKKLSDTLVIDSGTKDSLKIFKPTKKIFDMVLTFDGQLFFTTQT